MPCLVFNLFYLIQLTCKNYLTYSCCICNLFKDISLSHFSWPEQQNHSVVTSVVNSVFVRLFYLLSSSNLFQLQFCLALCNFVSLLPPEKELYHIQRKHNKLNRSNYDITNPLENDPIGDYRTEDNPQTLKVGGKKKCPFKLWMMIIHCNHAIELNT